MNINRPNISHHPNGYITNNCSNHDHDGIQSEECKDIIIDDHIQTPSGMITISNTITIHNDTEKSKEIIKFNQYSVHNQGDIWAWWYMYMSTSGDDDERPSVTHGSYDFSDEFLGVSV